MTDQQQAALAILKEDKHNILYRPRLSRLLGTTSAILLQQIYYWYGGKPFYKYRSPCDSDWYKPGDSWCEELGFSQSEFDTALKRIGTKCTKGTKKEELLTDTLEIPLPRAEETRKQYLERFRKVLKLLVVYWTNNDRQTFYELNLNLLGKLIMSIYQDKLDMSIYPVNSDSGFTFFTETTSENTTENKDLPPQSDGDAPDASDNKCVVCGDRLFDDSITYPALLDVCHSCHSWLQTLEREQRKLTRRSMVRVTTR
jgi:hypothetical protein